MILVDTNVLSELMRPKPNLKVFDWFFQWDAEEVFTSSITVAEIYGGIELRPQGKKQDFLRSLADHNFEYFEERVLPFDEMAAYRYAQILANQTKMGRPISQSDAMIAAIAIENNLELVTRNVKDFEEISGLKAVNPWEIGR